MRIFLKAGMCVVLMNCFFVGHAFSVDEPIRTISQSALLALQQHPKIFISKKQLEISQQQLSEVSSALLPTVSLNLGIGREDSNNTTSRAASGFGSVEMERRESSITLSQMLFDGFNADNLRRGQLETISSDKLAYQYLASEIALKAIEAHLDVALKNKLLDDHLSHLNVHEKIAKDIGLRVRSGKDDRARVSQISARLSLALANLEEAKKQVFKANSDYLRTTGERPGRQISFQDGLYKMPESEADLVNSVLQNNVFLQAKSKEIEAQTFVEKASISARYPSLYLESGASWNENIDGVSGRNSDAFIMLRMRYDLYKGGADRANERVAKLQTQSLKYELDDVYRDIKNEAAQVWYSYQSNAKRVDFLQDYVESAQTTKKAYAQQFNIGQRSLIDLLDAESELLRAKDQLHEARRSLGLSKFQILHLQSRLLASLQLEHAGE